MASILLIDDEPFVRVSIRLLMQAAGHHVETASDGEEGIRAGTAGRFDLVITDVIMPVRSGVDVIEALRAQNPDLKVIALSGGGRLGNHEMLNAALAAGASAVLPKPFRNAELTTLVSRVLSEPAAPLPGAQAAC